MDSNELIEMFEDVVTETGEQGSDQWKIDRGGKITSSRASEILGIKGLGETGKNYMLFLAGEIVFGVDLSDSGFKNKSMERGNEYEPRAVVKFERDHEHEFFTVTESDFIKLNEHTGGSPDRLVNKNALLEVKCPDWTTFLKLIRSGEVDPKYYAQIQHQLYVTARELCYFYNYVIYNGVEYSHEIIVKRDEPFIANLKARITEGTKLKLEYVEVLKAAFS